VAFAGAAKTARMPLDLKVSDGVNNAMLEIPKRTKPKLEVATKDPPPTLGAAGPASLLDCRVPDIVRRAEHGDGGAVLALLQGGESPDAADDFGLTALHVAAKKGHAAVVGHLVGTRADVNRRASGLCGETPAFYACKYGRAEVLSLLVRHGADPGLATTDGRLPSRLAREKGHLEVEAILLRVLRRSL